VNAVNRMLDDPALRVRCSEAGRRLACERFDSENNAQSFVKLIQETAGPLSQKLPSPQSCKEGSSN
jgi:glycosyltransferase involved in cell wall biosynthesis